VAGSRDGTTKLIVGMVGDDVNVGEAIIGHSAVILTV
jgi:hypothetical protein